jgi:hypothetical protein
MIDFEALNVHSPIKLVASPDEGFADLNMMDLVPDSEYISSNVSPLKDMAAKKQLNLGVYVCVHIYIM